jgi:hypothetical protein
MTSSYDEVIRVEVTPVPEASPVGDSTAHVPNP